MQTKTKNRHVRPYHAKNGAQQFKPSIQLCMAMSHDMDGFCLACAAVVPGVEPDAGKDTCPECGAPKVYGAEQLVLMGLSFDADQGGAK